MSTPDDAPPYPVPATIRQPMPVAALLCGRRREQEQIEGAMAHVPVAVIYGVAGVGKTSIAAAVASRWKGLGVYTRVVDPSLGMLLNDTRRALADGPVAELESNERRLSDVVRRLNDARGIWLLDDLQVLEESDATQLLAEICRTLVSGRVLATSRVRFPVRPGDPDRFELKLPPLDVDESRELWEQLDKLYGQVEGFETASSRAQGNPFSLRRAHAGGAVTLDEDDPMSATIRALDPDALSVARALAASRIRLSELLLCEIVPASRCRSALRSLFRSLVVEVDAAGGCSLHDLFRLVLLSDMDGTALASLHERMAGVVRDAALAPLVRIRETAYHLCAAGLFEEAGAYLSHNVFTVIEHGGASDLLSTIEALRPPGLAPSLETVRAILLVRTGECERGFRQLEAVRSRVAAPSPLLTLSLAQAATMTGRLALADQLLTDSLDRCGQTHPHFSRIARMLTVVRTIQGRMQDARDLLDAAEKTADTIDRMRKVEELRTFTYWFEGRYQEAEAPMQRASGLLERWPRPIGDLRLYITFAPVEANLGRFEDAEQTLRESSQGLSDSEELLPAAFRVERAVLLGERGDRIGSIALLREAIEEESLRGFRTSVWWARLQLGRNLLAMGRRREAMSEFQIVETESADAGALAIVAAVRRERSIHPLHPEEQGQCATVGTRIRHRCLAALRAAERGDAPRALAIIQEQQPVANRPGHGLDRAILELTHATIARLQGDPERAREHLIRSKQEALQDNVDNDLLDELIGSIGTVRLIESSGSSSLVREAQDESDGVTVDACTHVLRIGSVTVSLAHRPIVRQVLYALARRPNSPVSKDELAVAVWGVSYHPLRHDNTVRVTIRRLRVLLEGSPLRIETTDTGYLMSCSSRILFLEPPA